jgi:hypothetical protein
MGRQGFHEHPKLSRFMELLGVSKPLAIGYIECLWNDCYERVSERIGKNEDVIRATKYDGEGDIAAALVKAGFLDRRGSNFYVHDFWDHVPRWVRRRKERGSQYGLFGDDESSYLVPDAPLQEIAKILKTASEKYGICVKYICLTPKNKNIIRIAHGSKPSNAAYAGVFEQSIDQWRYFAERVGEDDWACGRDQWKGMPSWVWAIERAERYLTRRPVDELGPKKQSRKVNPHAGESNGTGFHPDDVREFYQEPDWDRFCDAVLEAPPQAGLRYERWKDEQQSSQSVRSRDTENEGVVQSDPQQKDRQDVSPTGR